MIVIQDGYSYIISRSSLAGIDKESHYVGDTHVVTEASYYLKDRKELGPLCKVFRTTESTNNH
jgi:hypothetical protein